MQGKQSPDTVQTTETGTRGHTPDVEAAKAIGWRQESYLFEGDGMWQHPDRKGGYTAPRYTVDDLLAWLAQFRFTSFHFGASGTYPAHSFYVDWGGDASHGETLLAAFEAAVRKIAEKQS